MDMYFKSREEAKQLNDHSQHAWKFLGTAKANRGYIAWRTNHVKQVFELLSNPEYSEIMIDKGLEIIKQKAKPTAYNNEGLKC
jgi:hypothetical protein